MSYSLARRGVAMFELLNARDARRLHAHKYQVEANELLTRAKELQSAAEEALKEAAWLDEAVARVDTDVEDAAAA